MACRSGNYIVQNDRKRPKRLKRNLEVTGFTTQRVQKTKKSGFPTHLIIGQKLLGHKMRKTGR